MKISCSQFEGLMTFYIEGGLSDSMNIAFEEHMHDCPACKMKFSVIRSIVKDIKNAYDKVIIENSKPVEAKTVIEDYNGSDGVEHLDLSAYIDNELSDENSVRVRRNIIAKPKIRKKLEKMYRLRKIMSGSFAEQKNTFRNDFSKEIVRSINTEFTQREVCIHCAVFIFVVILAVVISVWTVLKML